MKKRIGCLHAHYSNIDYIEQEFSNFEEIELVHFVDPGIMHRVSKNEEGLPLKAKEQLEWIAGCGVDAILMTCTNYIALLNGQQLSLSIPIIKMDEPYFETICQSKEPQMILFTNPATVGGTMKRLQQFIEQHEKTIDVEVNVIDDTFELLMQGKKEVYDEVILQYLHNVKHEERKMSVAQLSMVEVAKQFEKESGIAISHPLKTLVYTVLKQLKIK